MTNARPPHGTRHPGRHRDRGAGLTGGDTGTQRAQAGSFEAVRCLTPRDSDKEVC